MTQLILSLIIKALDLFINKIYKEKKSAYCLLNECTTPSKKKKYSLRAFENIKQQTHQIYQNE
jgi:hypothetical protein